MTHFLVQIVKVAVAVFDSPAVISNLHFNDVNLMRARNAHCWNINAKTILMVIKGIVLVLMESTMVSMGLYW